MKHVFVVLAVLLAVAGGAFAVTDTATTTLSLTVGPEASITVDSSPTLSSSGTEFANFTGDTTFTYKVRTTQTTGDGSITAQVTTDFSGTGAPSSSDLSYTCSGTGAGTACSGSQAASTSSGTGVRTFTADNHTAEAGDSATMSWTLLNKVATKTGTYNATVTLTISAS